MSRQLTLSYYIKLESQVGDKARSEAQVLEAAQKRMRDAIIGTTDKFSLLDRAVTQAGRNTSIERQIGYLRRMGNAIDAASAKALKLRQSLAAAVDKAPEKFGEVASGAYGAKTMLAPPLRAFSSLEAATQDLKISMTDAKGKVSANFDKISKEAEKLGNQLPGTTKDFMGAARALQTQGVPSAVIANGGLRASSYLGVLLGQNQEQSAETVAKLREAHGLKEDELVPMADLVQRGYFGFGIKPQDYLETAKYAASTYNTMGITGLEKAKETLAIQGMAANVGLEGSSFGTNYSMMLRRLGEIDSRQNRKSKEAKEVKALLGEHGIDMQFYDQEGKFGGNVNMLQQLAKLRKLNPLEQQKVTTRLFGVEAGRPAQILVQKGLEGYQAARETIDNQGDLDSRIALKLETFASKLEALGGTIENVMARIATQTGNALKPVMDGGNGALGSVGGFIERNPGTGTAMLAAGGAAGAYLTGRFGGALWKSLILRGAPAAGAVAPVAEAVAPTVGRLATAAKLLKYGGITAGIGAGLEAVSVLADEKADKSRELSRVGVTGAAGWLGGAAAGALGGSVVPGIGTFVGGVVGGLAGYFGSGAAFDAIWSKPLARAQGEAGAGGNDPRKYGAFAALGNVPPLDFLTLSTPGAAARQLQFGQPTKIELGEGKLTVDVRMTDERTTASAQVTTPMSGIRVSAGATQPQGSW